MWIINDFSCYLSLFFHSIELLPSLRKVSLVCHVDNCVSIIYNTASTIMIVFMIISSTDRGRVVGGLPDVVTIMEKKVFLCFSLVLGSVLEL